MVSKLILRREISAGTDDLPGELHPVLKRIYLARRVSSAVELDRSLSRLLEPGTLRGIGAAVALLADALKRQAEFYAKLFEVLNRHSDTISRVTFWGISDRRSWRSRQSPLLFDRELKPKPAYRAILDVGLDKNIGSQP